MPLRTDRRTSFDIPQPSRPPSARITANTRIRPNHICSSSELSQLSDTVPTDGPKYSAAQIAKSKAPIEIASLTRPRKMPTMIDIAIATMMRMSMIGIGDVVSARHAWGQNGSR